MAENEDGQEKSEEPSEKKKSESRKKGQVPRSRELTTLLMLVMSIVGLMLFTPNIVKAVADIMRTNFTPERAVLFDPNHLIGQFKHDLTHMIVELIPLFIVMVITAILANILLGGFNFSSESLVPKPSKMNPIKGIKKMFGTQGLVELLKSSLKILLLGAIAVALIWNVRWELFGLSDEPFPEALIHTLKLIAWQFLLVSLGMIIVALIDIPYQLWTHKKELKMTKQEVKDEHKNVEGNPEIKGRIRQMQREQAMQRMMGEVPKADVVITNPTHYAVAIQYDQESGGAPVVLAKGADLIALQIRSIAQAHDVPILEAPPLSRALYYSVEIGDEIPAGLYVAVAQVLAYIFQLKTGEIDASFKPDLSNLPIPDYFKR